MLHFQSIFSIEVIIIGLLNMWGFLVEKEILNGIIAPLLVILSLLFSVGSQVSQAVLEFSV